jgi:hypothetical protein
VICSTFRLLQPGLEQVLVSCLGHPARAGQMAVMDDLRVFMVVSRIDAKNDKDGFLPVGTFIFGVQKPNIRSEVTFVVLVDPVGLRRAIIKGRYGHANNSREHSKSDPFSVSRSPLPRIARTNIKSP